MAGNLRAGNRVIRNDRNENTDTLMDESMKKQGGAKLKTKFIAAAGFLLLISCLSGCATMEQRLARMMIKKAGITGEENYQQYSELKEKNALDESGFYAGEPGEDTEDTDGKDSGEDAGGKDDAGKDSTGDQDSSSAKKKKIPVTFGANEHMRAAYYLDEAMTIPADPDNCRLNPGESLYALVEAISAPGGTGSSDAASSGAVSSGSGLGLPESIRASYKAAFLYVYIYGDNGARRYSARLSAPVTDGKAVVNIPLDFSGREISIEPVGAFQTADLSLSACEVDDVQGRIEIAGSWMVNEQELNGNTMEVSALSSPVISYRYDSNTYFLLGTEPEYSYANNEEGIVVFDGLTPACSVELHKYLNAILALDQGRSFSINGGESRFYPVLTKLNIPKLRYGETVVITSDSEWEDLEECTDLILTGNGRDAEGYKYILRVPGRDELFLFDPSAYTYEHGTLAFSSYGQPITEPRMLKKGSKLFYEQQTAEDNYWLAPGENVIVVGDEDKTREALMNIRFTEKHPVTVQLEQPSAGGTVEYSVDGKKIDEETYQTYNGTQIVMNFIPWEGWSVSEKAHDGDIYTVTEDESQTVSGPDYEIEDVFTEDRDHMPELTVTFERSAADADVGFTIRSSGFGKTVTPYDSGRSSGWKVADIEDKENYSIVSSRVVISGQKIGTDKPVEIRFDKVDKDDTQSIRLTIVKEDSEGREETEVRYLMDTAGKTETIVLYPEEEMADSGTVYRSLRLSIDLADAAYYTAPEAAEHTFIAVTDVETGRVLQEEDLLDDSWRVRVTITPEDGWYLTGRGLSDGIFQKTMDGAEYLRTIESIIEDHPAEKYIFVTLDESDDFASYTYRLDGRSVSGTIRAREGQELSLVYVILDDEHRLKKGEGGFLGIGKNYRKTEKELTITPEMDGKTLTKEDFGIEVVAEE